MDETGVHQTHASAHAGTDGRRLRWAKHRADRRAAFVAAGAAAIDEHGPDASAEQIAAAAGVSRTVLYRYFRDREDLRQAIADHVVTAVIDSVTPHIALSPDVTPRQIITSAVEVIFGWLDEHPNLYFFLRSRRNGPGLDAVENTLADRVSELLKLVLVLFGLDAEHAEPGAFGIVGLVESVGLVVARPAIHVAASACRAWSATRLAPARGHGASQRRRGRLRRAVALARARCRERTRECRARARRVPGRGRLHRPCRADRRRHASSPVEVALAGHFDPISGKYSWYGRVAASPEVAELVADGVAHGAAAHAARRRSRRGLSDIDPWGRPRVEGFGRRAVRGARHPARRDPPRQPSRPGGVSAADHVG